MNKYIDISINICIYTFIEAYICIFIHLFIYPYINKSHLVPAFPKTR